MASPSRLLLLLQATSSPASAYPSTLATRLKRNRLRSRLSCTASAARFDRRDVLAGMTGVAAGGLGAGGAYPNNLAFAADDTSQVCPRGETVTDKLLACDDETGQKPCPPTSPSSPTTTIVDFTPPPATGPTRVRQPAHLADVETVAKYRAAVAAMKALPASDPRSFASQAAIHQAYCDGHYRFDATEKNMPFDVHFSWIFAPWHRMYIYFHERILGSLIGDETFALPYWNCDAPAGMALPPIFSDDADSPLHDAHRNPAHLGAFVNLDILNAGDTIIPFDAQDDSNNNQLVQNNLSTLYVQMVRNSRAEYFLGDKFCAEYPGTVTSGTSGALESMAHTGVHIWAGDPGSTTVANDGQEHGGADMGFLGTAARDPVFYSHHANVDRLWHLWSTTLGGGGGGRTNFDDNEWLDTSFVFFDETPRRVRVRVRDVLDVAKLNYSFDEREPLLWMDAKPTSSLMSMNKAGGAAATTATATAGRRRRRVLRSGGASSEAAPAFPLALTEGQSVEVAAVPIPPPPRAKSTADGGEEGVEVDTVLVLGGIEFEPGKSARFDVAINVPADQALAVGPRYREYAGSFATLPRGGGGNRLGETATTMVVPLVLPLDEVLADVVGVVGDEDGTVNVVIVPRTQGIKIISPPRIETRER